MISGIGNIPRITGLELGVPAAQTAPIGALGRCCVDL
jgi:hypothetical protein